MKFSKFDSLALKGAAICAMLFHHCFFTRKIYAGYAVSFAPFPEALINNLALFCKFCVGMFAFLSGYGLSLKWKKYRSEGKQKAFFVSRYLSTMSRYWLVFPLCCILCQLMDQRTQNVYFTGNGLENLFGLLASFLGISRSIGTPMLIYEWWYMSAAIVYILLVPVFWEGVRRVGPITMIAVVILLPRTFGIPFAGGTHPLSFFMPVLLGVIFEENNLFDVLHEKLNRLGGPVIKGTVLILGGLLAYKLYRRLPFEQYWEIKYGVVPAILIVCLNELMSGMKGIRRLFVYLGKHSMNMYLIHMLFLIYAKDFLFANRYFIISWLALMVCSLCGSIVLEYVEKLLKQLIRKLRSWLCTERKESV